MKPFAALFFAAAAFVTLSCNALRRPVAPIPTVDYTVSSDTVSSDTVSSDTVSSDTVSSDTQDALVVFLPGMFDRPPDFERSGFVEAVSRARPGVSMVAVDAHFGYYRSRTILERLWDDVLAPARERGTREIWLVGASLGGFGALLTAQRYGEAITGVAVLAPFVGPKKLLKEIEQAGGPRHWQATDPDDSMQALWLWLLKGDEASERPLIYLGYGRGDRSAEDHETLAGILPPERVVAVDGAHDWPTWIRAFELLLEQGALRGTETP